MPAVNGELLRRARLRKGWTLRAVVDKCAELGQPIDESNLSKVERGDERGGFSPRPLAVLAQALGLTVDDVLVPADGDGNEAA